jgi:hypothetical protein
MRTQPHPSAAPPRPLWSSRIWPSLAGTVTAVGVLAASSVFGVTALLAVYATLSMFAVATVWGLSLEIGIERPSVVRWGLYAALVVLVAAGLCQIHPLYGALVGVAVGVSSPAALRLLAYVRPRTTRRRTNRPAQPAPEVLVDKALLNRRFDDIVSHLRESGDFPES